MNIPYKNGDGIIIDVWVNVVDGERMVGHVLAIEEIEQVNDDDQYNDDDDYVDEENDVSSMVVLPVLATSLPQQQQKEQKEQGEKQELVQVKGHSDGDGKIATRRRRKRRQNQEEHKSRRRIYCCCHCSWWWWKTREGLNYISVSDDYHDHDHWDDATTIPKIDVGGWRRIIGLFFSLFFASAVVIVAMGATTKTTHKITPFAAATTTTVAVEQGMTYQELQQHSQQQTINSSFFPRVYNLTIIQHHGQGQGQQHPAQDTEDIKLEIDLELEKEQKEFVMIDDFTTLLDIIQIEGISCGRHRNRNSNIGNRKSIGKNMTPDTPEKFRNPIKEDYQRRKANTVSYSTNTTNIVQGTKREADDAASGHAVNDADHVEIASTCHVYFLIHNENELRFLQREYNDRFGLAVFSRSINHETNTEVNSSRNSSGSRISNMLYDVEMTDRIIRKTHDKLINMTMMLMTAKYQTPSSSYDDDDDDDKNTATASSSLRSSATAATTTVVAAKDKKQSKLDDSSDKQKKKEEDDTNNRKDHQHHQLHRGLQQQFGGGGLSPITTPRITSYSMINPIFPCYLTIQGMQDKLRDFVHDSKTIHGGKLSISLEDIGESYLRSIDLNKMDGYPIQVLTVTGTGGAAGNSQTTIPKAKKGIIMLLSGVHPREYTPPDLIVHWLENLIYYEYDSNADLTNMLDRNIIYWIPYVNPDGRKIATTFFTTSNINVNSNVVGGGSSTLSSQPQQLANVDISINVNPQLWRRKNLNDSTLTDNSDASTPVAAACNTVHETGVDLNRNYPFLWGMSSGSSNNPCSVIYRGVSPGSEPEIEAVVNFAINRVFPKNQVLRDVNPNPPISYENDGANYIPTPVNEETAKGVFIDLHSYGEHMIWPWGYTNKETPNHDGLEAFVNKLSYYNGYGLYGPGKSYTGSASGASDDWAYAMLGAVSITLELGTEFHESCNYFHTKIIPDNVPALNYATKISIQPYRLSKGPDIIEVNVSPKDSIVVDDGVDGSDNVASNNNENLVTVKVTASDKAFTAIDTVTSVQMIHAIRLYVNIHPHDIDDNDPTYKYLSFGSLQQVQTQEDFNNNDDLGIVSGELQLSLAEFLNKDGEISYGRQTLYIEAVDTDGFVGPITAVWVELRNANVDSDVNGDSGTDSPSLAPSTRPCEDEDISICNHLQQQRGDASDLVAIGSAATSRNAVSNCHGSRNALFFPMTLLVVLYLSCLV